MGGLFFIKTTISMKKAQYNRAIGPENYGSWFEAQQIALGLNGHSLKPKTESASGSRSSGSSGIWGSVFSNLGDWISSGGNAAANIIAASTGNYPEAPEIKVDNTPKVLAISAVAAIVLIVVLVVIFRK